MRAFFFHVFSFTRRRSPHSSFKQALHSSTTMSGSSTSAILYAATVSAASVTGTTPESAEEKRHHLKDGSGFINPWDSWRNQTSPQIMKAMGGFEMLHHAAGFALTHSQETYLRQSQSSRHYAAHGHRAGARLSPLEVHRSPSSYLAGTRMLLCRVSFWPEGSI